MTKADEIMRSVPTFNMGLMGSSTLHEVLVAYYMRDGDNGPTATKKAGRWSDHINSLLSIDTPIAKADQPKNVRLAEADPNQCDPARNVEGWSIGYETPVKDVAAAIIEMICSRYKGLSTSTMIKQDLNSVMAMITLYTKIVHTRQPSTDYDDGKLYVYDGESQTFLTPASQYVTYIQTPTGLEGEVADIVNDMTAAWVTSKFKKAFENDCHRLIAAVRAEPKLPEKPIAKADTPSDVRMNDSLANQFWNVTVSVGAMQFSMLGLIGRAMFDAGLNDKQQKEMKDKLNAAFAKLSGEIPAKPFDIAFEDLRLTRDERVMLAHHLGSMRYRKTVDAIVPGGSEMFGLGVSKATEDKVRETIMRELRPGGQLAQKD